MPGERRMTAVHFLRGHLAKDKSELVIANIYGEIVFNGIRLNAYPSNFDTICAAQIRDHVLTFFPFNDTVPTRHIRVRNREVSNSASSAYYE